MNDNKMSNLKETEQSTPAWHAEYPLSVVSVLKSRESGLTETEASAILKTSGRNELAQKKQPGLLARFFNQLKSPLTTVLLLALLITIGLQEFIDAIVIALALLIAVVVGLVQEGKANNAFAKLASSQEHFAQVRREGVRYQLPTAELVPGDIVYLQSGMQVPADIRLIKVKNLSVNEAPLTGEWLSVHKQVGVVDVGAPLADQTNMAWKGTLVASGSGLGVVVATGDNTAIGALAEGLRDMRDELTPLQREMQRVSEYMLYLIMGLITLIFVFGLVSGQSLEEMLLMSIAIAVASIPEGLPAALTIILAVGMEALLKRGGLVRNLLAAETLGSTTFVLTDKTGTLTEGRMSVNGAIIGNTFNTLDEVSDEEKERLFNVAVVAADAFYDEKAREVRGDPVEAAIFEIASEYTKGREADQEKLDYLPFTSEMKFAAGLVKQDESYRVCVNGAPNILLEKSTHFVGASGEVEELSDEIRVAIENEIKEQSSQGKRLVGVAYKDVLYNDIPDNGAGVLGGLTFSGVVVFSDPARENIAEAIAGVESAGARILLITGDNPATAYSIAREVGITIHNKRVLTGDEIAQYSDKELLSAIDSGVSVFARVLPQQKLRIAQLLQRRGEIVAMTGDGINDAPALQKANIGIAIGSGTEVAKEASDLVLLNDSFATIYAAIEEGRRIVSNLKKVVAYLLSTALSEVVLIGAALLTGAAAPLTATQILWGNIIEEGFMSVAFAFEKGDKNAMKMRPEDVHKEGILSKNMLKFMLFTIFSLSSLTLGLYFYLRSIGVPFEELRSVMFLSISIDSLFIAFAFRSLHQPLWKVPLKSNLFFLGSFAVSASLLVMVITVPFFHEFFSYKPLPARDIALVAGISFASLMMVEFSKVIFFRKREAVVE